MSCGMEDSFDIVECFSAKNQDCPLLPACTLKSILVDARRNFMATLDRRTLQDVLGHGVTARFAQNSIKSVARERAGSIEPGARSTALKPHG